jgi:hypothetical protein
MRLCTNCRQITTGKPLFCNRCGRSYNVRLCPRLHINPRPAKICSECGSKDLSVPQPKVSLLLIPLIFFIRMGPGILLLIALCVYLVFYVRKLIADPNNLLPMMSLGLVLAGLFLFWMMLPGFLKQLFRKLLGRKNKKDSHKH